MNKDTLSAHAPLVGAAHRGLKGEVVDGIASRIRSMPSCLLNACGESEKRLLTELVYGPESGIEASQFTAKYGVDLPKMCRWSGCSKNQGSVLVLVTDEDREEGVIRLASDLRVPLKKLLPPPARASVQTVPELPREHVRHHWQGTMKEPVRIYEGATHAFEEARRVLALVQQGKLKISSSTKRPTAAVVKKVTDALLTPDFELELAGAELDETAGSVRAHAWPVVFQQCGWAKATGTKLALTRKGMSFLKNPTAEAWREGFDRLLADKTFDELQRISNIRGQTGRGKRTRTPMPERRAAIAEGLSEWPVGEWLAFEDAFRFGIASGYGFSVNRTPWNLYFCEHNYGYLNDGDENELACQYMRVFLFETLATLGIVEVAYVPPHWLWPEFGDNWGIDDIPFCGRYDGLLYVRLTSLGAYCLDLTTEYQPPKVQGTHLRVLPNRDVVAVDQPELPPAVAALLGSYAKRKSDAVWRLEDKLIVAQLEKGGSIEDLRELLASHGAQELPDTVEAFLEQIARRANAITGGEDALLVHFRDAVTAALIANDTAGRKLCLAAGEKAVVVSKKNEKAFRTFVRRKGLPLTF
jgi:hypothetical protein